MKKLILSLAMIAMAATTFVACKKETGNAINKNTNSGKPTNNGALAKNYTSVFKMLNITISVSWKDGCYSSTTYWYPNGNIQSQTIRCIPGCDFCMVTGTATVVGMVTGGGNTGNPLGLDVPYSSNTSEYFGMVAKDPIDNTLIFAIDKTRISNEIYQSKFAGNTINLSSGFAIDENTFNVLGIDRAHQFIPAGNYPLHQEGNLVFFEYSLN